MYRTLLLASLFVVLMITPAAAGDGDAVLGVWATDPEGDGGQAHVEIFKDGDTYHGKIVWLSEPVYPPDDDQGMGGQEKVDRNNPDEALRDRPTLGLRIIEGFEYVGKDSWKKGTIYDPDNGKTYKSKMRFADDGRVLKVRGYVGVSLLGRTTEWTRVDSE